MRNPFSSTSSATQKKSEIGRGGGGGGGKINGLKRGPWTAEEDELLTKCINKEGEGKWRTLPLRAGLARCGKSCRLRWMNYLRPCVKRGQIAPDEEDLILRLHRLLGNRWSLIAGRIPGRTDNEIKNYWNTHLSKKLISQGIDPKTHKPLLETTNSYTTTYTTNTLIVVPKDGNISNSNDSGTSKLDVFITNGITPTSSGQNPNMHHLPQYNSGSVENGFEELEEEQIVHGGFRSANEAHEATGCYSDGYNQYHQSTNNLDSIENNELGGYHVNLQQRISSHGLGNEDGGDDGGRISCEAGMVEDDGMFSSFLNSLINDDMFV